MADPFQDVDAAGADFIAAFADAMDARQADPTMEKIVADYLSNLTLGTGTLTVEVGCGAGAVTRRIAAATPGQVQAFDPSAGFIAEAKTRAGDLPNITFAVAPGDALPLADGTADHVILHTVLTHVVDPAPLLAEAIRCLKPGGTLVICDADFSKASLSSGPNDPLDACARAFVAEFVTDAHLVSKLRGMIAGAGLTLTSFDIQTRKIVDNNQMLPWVEATTANMVARGDIGEPLRAAMIAEYIRRAETGTLYGFQVFATAIAQKH